MLKKIIFELATWIFTKKNYIFPLIFQFKNVLITLASAENLVCNTEFIGWITKTWLYMVLWIETMHHSLLLLTQVWSLGLGSKHCCFFSPLCFRADVGEVHCTIPETGLTNRIVALFEHAVQSENGTHCPLLWRMYLNFMVRRWVSVLFYFVLPYLELS